MRMLTWFARTWLVQFMFIDLMGGQRINEASLNIVLVERKAGAYGCGNLGDHRMAGTGKNHLL